MKFLGSVILCLLIIAQSAFGEGPSSFRRVKGRQQTTITSSTSETTIITADSQNLIDLYGLMIANKSATGVTVTIKDSTAGTTRAVIYVPATDTRGFMLPMESAINQDAPNGNWTATSSGSVDSLYVTALYLKAVPLLSYNPTPTPTPTNTPTVTPTPTRTPTPTPTP